MKKKILGLFAGLFLIVGLASSGYAANWYVDWAGDGSAGTTAAEGFFYVGSPNAVILDGNDFSNYGIVTILEDANSSYTLYGEYSLTGTLDANNLLDFTGGTMTLYVTDGTDTYEVATLDLTGGEGFCVLKQDGTVSYGVTNLEYTIASPEASSYLFWQDGDAAMKAGSIILTTTTMSMSTSTTDNDAVKAAFGNVDFSNALFLSSGGTCTANAVPVPSAVILLGAGMIGLVGFRRKNS